MADAGCNCGVPMGRPPEFHTVRRCEACRRGDHADCTHVHACSSNARGQSARESARRSAERWDELWCRLPATTAEGRWERTLGAWNVYHALDPDDTQREPERLEWSLARFRRDTRLARVGDVVIADINNGQGERCVVDGFTSRGRLLVHYYVQYSRTRHGIRDECVRFRDGRIVHYQPDWQRKVAWEAPYQHFGDKSAIEFLALPGELERDVGWPAVWPTHPGVRAHVLEELTREPPRTPGKRG